MTEMTKYEPGTFSWVDLATSDAQGAKAFYSALFGWEAEDFPEVNYTMFRQRGKSVAGMSQQNPEQQAQGMPPAWLSYVTVASADEAAATVKTLGGTVLMGPMDVMEEGRMGYFQDPTGAVFAVWQPKNHIGAELVNEPVSLSWNELATEDTDKARAFYTGLFGWGTQVQDMGNIVYTTFLNGERMNAGMLQMTEEWAGIPPHWMVYFAVVDCDESAKKAESLGGKILVPPQDIPPVGRFSVIQDPQGAGFTIIKLANPE